MFAEGILMHAALRDVVAGRQMAHPPLQSRTRRSPRLLWDGPKSYSFSGSGMSCPELHLISRTKFLAADTIKNNETASC